MRKYKIFQFDERSRNGIVYVDIRIEGYIIFFTKCESWNMLIYVYKTDTYHEIGQVNSDFVEAIIKEAKEYANFIQNKIDNT